jgi:hypothetical protein
MIQQIDTQAKARLCMHEGHACARDRDQHAPARQDEQAPGRAHPCAPGYAPGYAPARARTEEKKKKEKHTRPGRSQLCQGNCANPVEKK